VVIGTSNFQILFVAANVTFLQATTNGTVDVVLALAAHPRRRGRAPRSARGWRPGCRASSCAA